MQAGGGIAAWGRTPEAPLREAACPAEPFRNQRGAPGAFSIQRGAESPGTTGVEYDFSSMIAAPSRSLIFFLRLARWSFLL